MPFLKDAQMEENQLGGKNCAGGQVLGSSLCPVLPEDCFRETNFPLAKLEWGFYPT